jgi:hypothetical protein|tara:strand:+ start:307 stop:408 length:102 start_codon:yes stop_codon:yes gene_type:complete
LALLQAVLEEKVVVVQVREGVRVAPEEKAEVAH